MEYFHWVCHQPARAFSWIFHSIPHLPGLPVLLPNSNQHSMAVEHFHSNERIHFEYLEIEGIASDRSLDVGQARGKYHPLGWFEAACCVSVKKFLMIGTVLCVDNHTLQIQNLKCWVINIRWLIRRPIVSFHFQVRQFWVLPHGGVLVRTIRRHCTAILSFLP